MLPAAPAPTWGEVGSSFAAQLEHASALLDSATAVTPMVADAVAYDSWPVALTDLTDDELAQARGIYDRQRRLIARLEDALATIRQQQALLDAPADLRSRAAFVDQRA
jgi:uncharacterized membrane protein affecting hemolysin expression